MWVLVHKSRRCDAGGVASSLGETFSPELSSGTADFYVRFDTPNGPNDIGPRLELC